MSQTGTVLLVMWLELGLVIAVATTRYLAAQRTTEQQWVLGIVLFLLAPLVAVAWMFVGAWHAGRALARGVGQWRHEFATAAAPPPDPLLREAEREVQQLLE